MLRRRGIGGGFPAFARRMGEAHAKTQLWRLLNSGSCEMWRCALPLTKGGCVRMKIWMDHSAGLPLVHRLSEEIGRGVLLVLGLMGCHARPPTEPASW
jgi:hypothetical protein